MQDISAFFTLSIISSFLIASNFRVADGYIERSCRDLRDSSSG
jgi:hypothetical protein